MIVRAMLKAAASVSNGEMKSGGRLPQCAVLRHFHYIVSFEVI